MALWVATTTWNSVDLIGLFLVHYRRLGFDQALVMDFDSLDGTADVLASGEWRGFVRRVPFPGIARLDSSSIMLSIVKESGRSGDWCLFCDPDELLVTPSMNAGQDLPAVASGVESLTIPRFNVTARVSDALSDGEALTALGSLNLRIDRRHARSIAEDTQKDVLVPPWIFTAIPGKVLVRVESALAIGDGDHSATTAGGRTAASAGGSYLLHYPFRSYPLFSEKIERAREAFRQNPHLADAYGWQLRRWIALADADRLHQEYLQQFIPDEELDHLLRHGAVARDDSVGRFHRRK